MTFDLQKAAENILKYIDSIITDIACCYAYVNDLLISSSDAESHKNDLELVFRRLIDHGIVVNPQKCMFGQLEFQSFGFLVSSLGISALPEKVPLLLSNFRYRHGCKNCFDF
ncbi:transposon Ty3-I Gag-Pol polyprotein [Nephila pilipes]|uniref:Transposon Ty3-I Gag-Pol polyprotein n=1 Tax=Nephila pilipes TaxID=299642 RepID=A0A8X6Q5E9_NEPPI|nr:transposon Ty3-I Gag-Pol polyprotein [Nephila pilipes]